MHAQNTSVEINTIFFTEKNQTKTQVTEVHLPFVLYLIYQIPGTQIGHNWGPLFLLEISALFWMVFSAPTTGRLFPASSIVYRRDQPVA